MIVGHCLCYTGRLDMVGKDLGLNLRGTLFIIPALHLCYHIEGNVFSHSGAAAVLMAVAYVSQWMWVIMMILSSHELILIMCSIHSMTDLLKKFRI